MKILNLEITERFWKKNLHEKNRSQNNCVNTMHQWADHVVLAISNQLILNNVLQFCGGILMLCINCLLNNRNYRYYEKKV
jgi:hypothetical protein